VEQSTHCKCRQEIRDAERREDRLILMVEDAYNLLHELKFESEAKKLADRLNKLKAEL
jgi:hypothetical protein